MNPRRTVSGPSGIFPYCVILHKYCCRTFQVFFATSHLLLTTTRVWATVKVSNFQKAQIHIYIYMLGNRPRYVKARNTKYLDKKIFHVCLLVYSELYKLHSFLASIVLHVTIITTISFAIRQCTAELCCVCTCVCCCHSIYSGRKVCGRTSRGHTGGRPQKIFPPSVCGACLNFSREKGSAIPFPRRQ